MQLRHLRYFVGIVDAGSFSRAAATIHVAQPALSLQIAELEKELGVSLLHRSARGVRATAAGEALYREAVTVLRQVESLPGIVRSAGGEAEGVVSLGMSSTLASYLAGPFMEACKAWLPKITLRLITGDSNRLKSGIESGGLDLATIFEAGSPPGFERKPLFRQRLYLIRRGAAPHDAVTIPLAQVARMRLVMPAHPNVARTVLDEAFAAAGLEPNIVAEADVLYSMLAAVQAGLGDAILPKGDFADVPGHSALQPVLIEPPLYLTAVVVCSSEIPLSHVAGLVRDRFAAFVGEQLRAAPPPGAEWIGA